MTRQSLVARLVAFAASATITLSVVVLVAGHALPADGGSQLLARATATVAR